MKLRRVGLFCLLVIGLCFGAWKLGFRRPPIPNPAPRPRLTRPYGMAPQAFEALVRACYHAQIHPFRIGQTIGEHPLSVGYHHRDGQVEHDGQKFDYTAAVDLGTSDLSRAQINAFLPELGEQGFAAFYREGGKWENREHIHAIYAVLPMKPQLRGQVLEWLRERRENGTQPHAWEVRLRKHWGLRRG